MGEKGSPRLYQSQEMLQDGAQRGSCGVQVQASQVAKGVRDQRSRAIRGLLSPRLQEEGKGVFRPVCVPQEERGRPESWGSRGLQAHCRPWEA